MNPSQNISGHSWVRYINISHLLHLQVIPVSPFMVQSVTCLLKLSHMIYEKLMKLYSDIKLHLTIVYDGGVVINSRVLGSVFLFLVRATTINLSWRRHLVHPYDIVCSLFLHIGHYKPSNYITFLLRSSVLGVSQTNQKLMIISERRHLEYFCFNVNLLHLLVGI